MQIQPTAFIWLVLAHALVVNPHPATSDARLAARAYSYESAPIHTATSCHPPGGASIFISHPARPEYEFHVAPFRISTYPRQLKPGLVKEGFKMIPAARLAPGEGKNADLDGRYCGWTGWAPVSAYVVDRGYISWRKVQMTQPELNASMNALENNVTAIDTNADDVKKKYLELEMLLEKIHSVISKTHSVEVCMILVFSLWPVYIPLVLLLRLILFALGKAVLKLYTETSAAIGRSFERVKGYWLKRPIPERTETTSVPPNVAHALAEIQNRYRTQKVPRSPPPAWSERDLPIYKGFNNRRMERP